MGLVLGYSLLVLSLMILLWVMFVGCGVLAGSGFGGWAYFVVCSVGWV